MGEGRQGKERKDRGKVDKTKGGGSKKGNFNWVSFLWGLTVDYHAVSKTDRRLSEICMMEKMERKHRTHQSPAQAQVKLQEATMETLE